jgi:hypothetical protein
MTASSTGRYINKNVTKQWKDYSSNMAPNKTNNINELQKYLCHAFNGLDMVLQLHFINPF